MECDGVGALCALLRCDITASSALTNSLVHYSTALQLCSISHKENIIPLQREACHLEMGLEVALYFIQY